MGHQRLQSRPARTATPTLAPWYSSVPCHRTGHCHSYRRSVERLLLCIDFTLPTPNPLFIEPHYIAITGHYITAWLHISQRSKFQVPILLAALGWICLHRDLFDSCRRGRFLLVVYVISGIENDFSWVLEGSPLRHVVGYLTIRRFAGPRIINSENRGAAGMEYNNWSRQTTVFSLIWSVKLPAEYA